MNGVTQALVCTVWYLVVRYHLVVW